MWKLVTYLMMLTVSLSSRRYRASKEIKRNICGKRFVKTEQVQKHMRYVHPDTSLEKMRLNSLTDKEPKSTSELADKNIACNSRSPKASMITRGNNNNNNNNREGFSFSLTFSLAFIITLVVLVSGLASFSQNHINQVYAT